MMVLGITTHQSGVDRPTLGYYRYKRGLRFRKRIGFRLSTNDIAAMKITKTWANGLNTSSWFFDNTKTVKLFPDFIKILVRKSLS